MKSSAIKFLSVFFLFAGISSNAQESVITKNELPQEAQKFISNNFPKNTVDFVITDKEIISTDYKVKFKDKNRNNLEKI